MDNNPSGQEWPGGHRAALCVSIDIDGPWGELNARPDDTYWVSQTAYDQVGLHRLLQIMLDRDVRGTLFWVGRDADNHPEAVRNASAHGHELAVHSWDHRWYSVMTEAEQRQDIERSIAILTSLTGALPTGFKSPGWRFDGQTHQIAAECGLEWTMDIPNGDLPSELDSGLINLPPSWLADDYSYFVDHRMTPESVFQCWRDDLDVLRESGGLLSLTLHPFVSGRPGPSRALAWLLDYAIDLGDIWIAPGDQIAKHWRGVNRFR